MDEDKDGANLDHLIVKILPKDTINNHVDTVKKTILYRPLTDEGYRFMTAELEKFDWDFLAKEENIKAKKKKILKPKRSKLSSKPISNMRFSDQCRKFEFEIGEYLDLQTFEQM